MKMKLVFLFFVMTFFCTGLQSFSQSPDANPGNYITAVSNAQADMNKKYLAYVSAVAHGRRARKIEKMRQQVLESITQSRYKTIDLPMYKGDNSLRQSSIDYIKLTYDIFNEDYARIVNLEEIAEQSYDEMQRYLLLQEKTGEKLKEANDKMSQAQKDFAAKYNVTLLENKSEISEKSATASRLNRYMNQVFLIVFKCQWQDGELVKAINNKKVNEVEQSRVALLRYATEGLKEIDQYKHFNNDASLAAACRQVLNFYKGIAEKEVYTFTDFLLKQENFEKIHASFSAKSGADKTKAEVDAYNKAVNDINAAINNNNKLNNAVNGQRVQVLNNYQQTEKSFADTHMPYFK